MTCATAFSAAEHPPELRHFAWVVLACGLVMPACVLRGAGYTKAERMALELGGEIVPVYRWAHVADRGAAGTAGDPRP